MNNCSIILSKVEKVLGTCIYGHAKNEFYLYHYSKNYIIEPIWCLATKNVKQKYNPFVELNVAFNQY